MDNVKVSLLDQAVSFKLRIPAASVAYGSVTESGDLEALRSVLSSVINLLSQDGYAIDQIRVRSVPSPGTEGQHPLSVGRWILEDSSSTTVRAAGPTKTLSTKPKSPVSTPLISH